LEQWYGYNEPMVFEDAFANVLSNWSRLFWR
jgi:hypothetical protein